MLEIASDRLHHLIDSVLRRAGSHPAEAEAVASHLVAAQLAGHDSHGLSMLPLYLGSIRRGKLKQNAVAQKVVDAGAIAVYEGGHGFGMATAPAVVVDLVVRTREHGVALVVLRHSGHLGRIGTYGEAIARAGLAGVLFVNAIGRAPTVAPHGGAEPRFSSNPVCIALPAVPGEPPFVLDIATAAIAIGKARIALQRGEALPEGVLLDDRGRPTTDPRYALQAPLGALLPFGGHKGSGLALAAELICGALAGGGTAQPGNPAQGVAINNLVAIAFDPSRLGDTRAIIAEMKAMLDWVRSARPLDATQPVLVPGESEAQSMALRTHSGVPIDPATWSSLVEAVLPLGMDESELRALACPGDAPR